MFFEDLGMQAPASIQKASDETDQFSSTVSAEQADVFDDVDIIVTYGGDDLVDDARDDELAVSDARGQETSRSSTCPVAPLGTAANPHTAVHLLRSR